MIKIYILGIPFPSMCEAVFRSKTRAALWRWTYPDKIPNRRQHAKVCSTLDATRDTMESLFGSEPCLNELLRMIDQAVELSRNGNSDVENIHAIGEGWTGEEALGIAIYCSVKYQDDFSGAIIAAVNHNGDSDSTGAIAGNIVGARLGMEAIDGKWLRGLELKNTILEMASDLYHGCPINEDGTVMDEEWKRKYVAWCHRPASREK